MEVVKRKSPVMFDVPLGAMRRLSNGDVVFGGRVYYYPEPFLEKQEIEWHLLGKDGSLIGSRMHQLLLKFGFSPIGGCSCNSIAGKMNANMVEWVEEHEDELVYEIGRGVRHYRRFSWGSILLRIRNACMLLLCKLIPMRIQVMLIRCLLKKAIRDERRRWGANATELETVSGTIR